MSRQRAIALKALDARQLLHSRLPFVLQAMSPPQIDQVQRFLDAQVVNPQVYKERQELERKSNPRPVGQKIYREPAVEAEMNKKEQQYIRLGDTDKRIRLDFTKLLARDAFLPETDNPDEASYHIRVRNTLAATGVWLRFDRRFLAAIERPETVADNDPKRYVFALSLGSEGSVIPTTTGQLTRDALRKTSAFAVDYGENVVLGPTRMLLKRAITTLQSEAHIGWRDHIQYLGPDGKGEKSVARYASEAKAGVDLPDIRMWDVARKNLIQASESLGKGRFAEAHQHIQIAAIMIVIAAQAIGHYMEVTSKAASQILAVLEIAETAGEIAGALLIVRSVGMRILRAVTVDGVPLIAETGVGAGGGAAATGATNRGSTTVLTGSSGAPGAANRGNATVLTGRSGAPGAATKGNNTVATGAGAQQPGAMARTLPPQLTDKKYGDLAFGKTNKVSQSYERAVKNGEQYAGKSTGGPRSKGDWSLNSEELVEAKRIRAYYKEFYEEMAKLHKKYPHRYDFTADIYSLSTRLAAKYRVLPTQNLP